MKGTIVATALAAVTVLLLAGSAQAGGVIIRIGPTFEHAIQPGPLTTFHPAFGHTFHPSFGRTVIIGPTFTDPATRFRDPRMLLYPGSEFGGPFVSPVVPLFPAFVVRPLPIPVVPPLHSEKIFVPGQFNRVFVPPLFVTVWDGFTWQRQVVVEGFFKEVWVPGQFE